MTVRLLQSESIQPDVAPTAEVQRSTSDAFTRILDELGAVLDGAKRAEDMYAAGSGSLREAVYERARADVALAVAVTAAQRTAQSLQTILNMQI